MREFLFFLMLTGVYPLGRAWWANRRTSLSHAMTWAIAAWTGWLAGWFFRAPDELPIRYLGLCLTGGAIVAVLGARRPQAGPWNLVVMGFFTIMLLPLAEHQLLQRVSLGSLFLVLLAGTLAVGVLNYVPTCLGLAALVFALGCTAEMAVLAGLYDRKLGEHIYLDLLGGSCFALAPWLAWWTWPARPATREFDRLWLDFRNRYGLVWGQRIREQFNRSAVHATWPVVLSWRGLRQSGTVDEVTEREMIETMKRLLQRFV